MDGLPSLDYSPKVWFSLSILSLFSTALAYVILFRLLRRAGPSNTSLNTFIIPIVGILVGILFLDERLVLEDIVGVILIFIGVAIIQNASKLLKNIVNYKTKKSH
jgi:drug/metabolite transporter (DMT)-like permease